MQSTAHFSDCSRYRYYLSRRWSPGKSCTFVGLNPSTADDTNNDATVSKCIRFAQLWGFSGMTLVNLYARRCRYPEALRTSDNPIGPDNDAWLLQAINDAPVIVAMWGNHGVRAYDHGTRRDLVVMKHRNDWQCLGITKLGAPKHPLYLPSTTTLRSFHCENPDAPERN